MVDAAKTGLDARDRDLVSSLFISMLVALAYKEMVPPVRDSVRASGVTLETAMLSLTFVLTSIRFTIGNQLHLLRLVRVSGRAWLVDFMFVFLESFIFVFLGGLCSLSENLRTHWGFVRLFVIVLGIDMSWILVQWVTRRERVPWPWAAINGVFVAVLAALALVFKVPPYSRIFLAWLGALSVIAFLADMWLTDSYGLLVPSTPTEIEKGERANG